jgi:hypothetical protein
VQEALGSGARRGSCGEGTFQGDQGAGGARGCW